MGKSELESARTNLDAGQHMAAAFWARMVRKKYCKGAKLLFDIRISCDQVSELSVTLDNTFYVLDLSR